ncbi:MAG: globin domain-containing protein [Halioglobus sp.]
MVIESSYKPRNRAKDDKHAFTDSFYKTLFATNPQLKPLFANTNMPKQGTKLYATLVLLVENLRHPVELERVLLPLGNRHRGYGATPKNYPMVISAILQTLEKYLGQDWTPAVATAWRETCEHVQEIVLRGAGEGLAAEPLISQRTHENDVIDAAQRNTERKPGTEETVPLPCVEPTWASSDFATPIAAAPT